MKLDLSEIAATLGKSYRYEVNEACPQADDLRCVEAVTGSVEFTNTGRLIVARGRLSTTIELECSRCLEKLTLPVSASIDEQFQIANLQATLAGEEEEVTEEEQEPLFQENVFDLSEFIRQAILVQVPIKPLCSETCKGLCPTCGKHLNQGPCDCPVSAEPSPLAVLGEMLGEHRTADCADCKDSTDGGG